MTKNMFRFVSGGTMLYRLIMTTLLAGFLFILSCDFPLGTGNGESSLTVVLPGGNKNGGNTARSVLSNDFTAALRYQITLTGPGGTINRTAEGGSVTVSLEPGEWAIAVEAYDSADNLAGTGNETIVVVPGKPASVIIKMNIDPGYEADLTDIYIHNEAELRRIGTDFAIDGSKTFHLENDITITQPWTPIGDDGGRFKAVFDGGGHTVTMNGGFEDLTTIDLGLFGYADDAEIKNLNIVWNIGSASSPVQLPMPGGSPVQNIGGLAGTLANASNVENVSVRGFFCFKQTGSTDGLLLGGIAGFITEGSEIQSCSVSDIVIHGNGDTAIRVGGVAGTGDDGSSIIKSSFSGTVNSGGLMGGALYAGGIVGSLGTLSSIKRCYAVGIVQSETTSDYSNSGGIAGSSEGSIENCYVYTMVSSSSSYGETAGGIAGINDGTMDKCYAIGAVQCRGTDPYTQIGGIAGGEWSGGGQVNNCISLVSTLDGGPSASINKTVHAIMGSNSYTTLTGNYSRNDIDIINRTDSDDPGSNAKDGEGKPLNNFQSPDIYTTAGWNFGGDWKFISGYDFPVLSWQTSPPDLSAVPDSFVIIWP